MNDSINQQYIGFLNTPSLWQNSLGNAMQQFEINTKALKPITNLKLHNSLGKRVEQFFIHHLKTQKNYDIIATNIQINDNTLTIGELDALLRHQNTLFHVEIVYKFYLYDASLLKQNILDCFIGPNKKDTLIYKLKKLKEKQLPLLFNKHTNSYLSALKLNAEDFLQYVCFKAQLFLPYNTKVSVLPLNPQCIYGYYISYNNFNALKDYQFYIPKKLDWLIQPHHNVPWLSYTAILPLIESEINRNNAPMLWVEKNFKTIEKCFVVWW